jgi:hypothetical protein
MTARGMRRRRRALRVWGSRRFTRQFEALIFEIGGYICTDGSSSCSELVRVGGGVEVGTAAGFVEAGGSDDGSCNTEVSRSYRGLLAFIGLEW